MPPDFDYSDVVSNLIKFFASNEITEDSIADNPERLEALSKRDIGRVLLDLESMRAFTAAYFAFEEQQGARWRSPNLEKAAVSPLRPVGHESDPFFGEFHAGVFMTYRFKEAHDHWRGAREPRVHPLTEDEFEERKHVIAANPSIELSVQILKRVFNNYLEGVYQAALPELERLTPTPVALEQMKATAAQVIHDMREQAKTSNFSHMITPVLVKGLTLTGQPVRGEDFDAASVNRHFVFATRENEPEAKKIRCPVSLVFIDLWNTQYTRHTDGSYHYEADKTGGFYDSVIGHPACPRLKGQSQGFEPVKQSVHGSNL